jgi:transposase
MPAQRKYPDELRERAVRMVVEIRARDGRGHGELARVGRQLGVHPEALRGWVKQAEIDNGTCPGATTEEQRRIAESVTSAGQILMTVRRPPQTAVLAQECGRHAAGHCPCALGDREQ